MHSAQLIYMRELKNSSYINPCPSILVKRFVWTALSARYKGDFIMKKVMVVWMLVMLSFIVSCNNSLTSTPEEKVDKLLQELKNYEAEMIVTFTNNKKTTTMKMKQSYDANGNYEMTLLEPESLKGYKTIWNGDTMEEYNPVTDKKVQAKPNPVKNQVLFGTFLHNYLHGERMSQPPVREGEYLTVEVAIPGNYKYMAKEKVWFDAQTAQPVKMEIYDKEGNVTIAIEITLFQYNQ